MESEDKQGSQAWLDKTQFSWGGSSIGYLTGSNKYKTLNAFVSDRIYKVEEEKEKPRTLIAMNFGSWGEDIIRLYLMAKTGSHIEVRGAIPYKKTEGRFNIHYSMDGIFTTNASRLEGAEFCPNEDITYLLEIKCPWTREIKIYKTKRVAPKGSCKILKSYEDQVKMGLVIIEDAQAGLFIDSLLRICPLEGLTNIDVISKMHKVYPTPFTKVLASGVTLIYIDNLLSSSYFGKIKRLEKLYSKVPNTFEFKNAYATFVINHKVQNWEEKWRPQKMGPIDFGGEDFAYILNELKEDEKRSISEYTLEHILNFGLKEINIENRPNLLGYIPWKIFDLKYALVEKDPEYLLSKIDQMTALSELMHKCKMSETEEEREALIEQCEFLQ